MTVTNPNGNGVELYGRGTNVEVLKCCVKMCKCDGVYMVDGAVLTATQCEFTGNGGDGVCCGAEQTLLVFLLHGSEDEIITCKSDFVSSLCVYYLRAALEVLLIISVQLDRGKECSL